MDIPLPELTDDNAIYYSVRPQKQIKIAITISEIVQRDLRIEVQCAFHYYSRLEQLEQLWKPCWKGWFVTEFLGICEYLDV